MGYQYERLEQWFRRAGGVEGSRPTPLYGQGPLVTDLADIFFCDLSALRMESEKLLHRRTARPDRRVALRRAAIASPPLPSCVASSRRCFEGEP